MFDSVLERRSTARTRAVGSGVSVLLHGLILFIVIWVGNRPKAVVEKQAVPVAFIPKAPGPAVAPPPPPPPPPKASHKPHPHVEKPVIKQPLVIPKEIPKEKPPEKPPEKTPPPDDDDDSSDDDNGGMEGGVEGGVKGGVVGGVKGGVVGGVLGGQLGGGGDIPVFLGDGMTKPVVDLGETSPFHCTTAEQDQHLEGLVLTQCTVTRDGLLRDCKILKRVNGFDDTQVLEYLAHMKWKPAMQGAAPLSIKSFTIPLRLKCNS